MARVQTVVQLSEHLIDQLDRRASKDGVSRSNVIRSAVEAYLAEDAWIDEQIVAGYQRLPQSSDPLSDWSERRRREAWGDLDW